MQNTFDEDSLVEVSVSSTGHVSDINEMNRVNRIQCDSQMRSINGMIGTDILQEGNRQLESRMSRFT